jgi:CIC family chloride channel protein
MIDIKSEAGIPVAPSLDFTPEPPTAEPKAGPLDGRTIMLSLVGIVTNASFYGRFSTDFSSPAQNRLGLWVILVPALGGLIVGLMARYGSKAIRGHGIPEAMEQVLTNGSRIRPRIMFLKPLSAAVAIGTGGPFGAEGPIIATGGALGSVVGQFLHTTGTERKILLSAGAAAGMTAIFGSPVAAVLLAIELLLFEFNARSVIPVAIACISAALFRIATVGAAPVFAMPHVAQAPPLALLFYVLLGFAIGLCAVGVTRIVYAVEDAFERLPIHFMWWPAIGGLAVGLIGYFSPRTLGVGYNNITDTLGGQLTGETLLLLVVLKFISWAISLGSGTSGGTLAPLLTIGGGIGALLGTGAAAALPHWGIDPRIAALVGMAGLFSGASRALLTSLVFAVETTMQPAGLLPLLGGCVTSYLVSGLMLPNTIMTEKIERRGVRVPATYVADYLQSITVGDCATADVKTLRGDARICDVRAFLNSAEDHASHQGFPIVDEEERLIGVLTRRNIFAADAPDDATLRSRIKTAPIVIGPDSTLRDAADRMADTGIGRIVVVDRERPDRVRGILTRSDLIDAHRRRITVEETAQRHLHLRRRRARPAS